MKDQVENLDTSKSDRKLYNLELISKNLVVHCIKDLKSGDNVTAVITLLDGNSFL